MQHDPLTDALTTIKNAEKTGKQECMVKPASKMIGRVLKVIQDNGYIKEFEFIEDGRAGIFRVRLAGRINNCGVIKPRFAVQRRNFEKYEERFLPAQNFGLIVMTTTRGVISHYQAKEHNIGGKLLAFIY